MFFKSQDQNHKAILINSDNNYNSEQNLDVLKSVFESIDQSFTSDLEHIQS